MKRKIFLSILVFLALSSAILAARKPKKNKSNIPTVSLVVWDKKAKEGSNSAEFRIYLQNNEEITPNLKVYFKLSGTAKNGFDYKPIPNFIRIENNRRLKNAQKQLIFPIDDRIHEGDEVVNITLVEDYEYRIDPEHSNIQLVIQDNEIPDVQFSIPASKGLESNMKARIDVVLSKPVPNDVTVYYDISSILAKKDDDFALESEKIVIPAGNQQEEIHLLIKDDKLSEYEETVIFRLKSALGANIGLNEKHFYSIVDDDGKIERNIIHDKIYGIILGSRAGSSLGAPVELVKDMEQIEKIYGGLVDSFLPYVHYNDTWTHPAGATEDGIERQKLMCTAIIEKQGRITAEDLVKIWIRDCEIEDMSHMTQPYDMILRKYAEWGMSIDELPHTKFGKPFDLGEHLHLTARSFQAIPCINACDPEGALEDMKKIGSLYYEDDNDDAYAWGAVYNAAMTLAMKPKATIDSVIQGALNYATPEIKKEIKHGLAIADKYKNPMNQGFRKELNAMYEDTNSPYFAERRMSRYIQSSIYENVTCAFAIFKATAGNVKQAVIVATNRGRDSDCTAASAGALAGALSGSSTIPKKWIKTLDEGTMRNPYTNSHLSNRATSDALYRALQNRILKIQEYVRSMEKKYDNNLPELVIKKKEYIELMKRLGVI